MRHGGTHLAHEEAAGRVEAVRATGAVDGRKGWAGVVAFLGQVGGVVCRAGDEVGDVEAAREECVWIRRGGGGSQACLSVLWG